MDKNEEQINNKQKLTQEKLNKMRERASNEEECKIIANKLIQYIMQDKK